METINHECYVSLEVAKLLKEAGFDWEIRSLYDEQNNFVCSLYRDWNNVTICKSAPTLAVAQRWLREIKGYAVSVYPSDESDGWLVSLDLIDDSSSIWTKDLNNTYEEALEAGIKKCLTLLLKNED